MKTTVLLLIIFWAFSCSIKAQLPNFAWVKSMGASGTDWAYSITTDAAGNIYTAGSFEGSVDFDPGIGTFNLISNGESDIFIQKLDAGGNFIWAKKVGGMGNDEAFVITTDTIGNIYTVGYFEAAVDFDPGTGTTNLISNGESDIFIQKLDTSGDFIWAKSLGSEGAEFALNVTIDVEGNVITVGQFYHTVDFDPGTGTVNLISNGASDIFIQKLDANGNFIWAKSIGSSTGDDPQSVSTDSLGNIFISGGVGGFNEAVDFDPGPGVFNIIVIGYYDVFTQKLDTNGDFLWAKSIGSTGVDSGYDHAAGGHTDQLGNIYTIGVYSGTADFDPGPETLIYTSNGELDFFIQKLDGNGNLIWAKSMGASEMDRAHSITNDALGNVYIVGSFMNTVDFDPGPDIFNLSSNGGWDIYILKIDANGDFSWAMSMGSTWNDAAYSITTDTLGNIYTTGYFEGALEELIDFDPGAGTFNLISNQTRDVFIQKLSQNDSTVVEAVNELVIPTAITPNNDQINDIWNLENIDVLYPENIVRIFNRWGNKLYESNQGDYISRPWDGYFNGELLPINSYYFILEFNDNYTQSEIGTVTIIK